MLRSTVAHVVTLSQFQSNYQVEELGVRLLGATSCVQGLLGKKLGLYIRSSADNENLRTLHVPCLREEAIDSVLRPRGQR